MPQKVLPFEEKTSTKAYVWENVLVFLHILLKKVAE